MAVICGKGRLAAALISSICLFIVIASPFASAQDHPLQKPCTIFIEYNHGGWGKGHSKGDEYIAQQLKSLMKRVSSNCEIDAVANDLDSNVLPGGQLITRRSLVDAEQKQIDEKLVPNSAELFKVSYSASGGPTLELFANPNLGAYNPELQESLNRLLDRYTDLGVKLHVVLVDPYPPLAGQPSNPESFARKLEHRLARGPLKSVTAIHFTKPLWTAPPKTLLEEAGSLPEWLENFFTGYPPAGQLAKPVAGLTFDVPLNNEWHVISEIKSNISHAAPLHLYNFPFRHDELHDALPDIAKLIEKDLSEGER